MPLNVGDTFPDGIVFSYVPYEEANSDIAACGIPIQYNASKEFKDKKVVLFAVPGAFTPTCSVNHLPSFIKNLSSLKSKGIDQVLCIAYNDPFVMNAWSKANNVKNDDIIFATDADTKFSKAYAATLGERTGRYAMIIDHGKVTYYAAEDSGKEVGVSGADAVMAKL